MQMLFLCPQTQDTPYEEAADVCQKELAQRKAITEAKAKAQAAQVQMQAQALQVQQAQIQAQVQAQNQALQPQAIKVQQNNLRFPFIFV